MFPSLDAKKVAKLVAEEFLNQDIQIANINHKQLGKYVALNWTVGQIRLANLHHIVPKRRYSRGPKPKITGEEAKGGKNLERADEESQWEYPYPTREPKSRDLKKLVAAALEISISASFSNHIYCFGGQVFRQLVGGPIGSRLTMEIARVIMMLFGRQMRSTLEEAGIQIHFEACYVDDLRYILSLLALYMSWDKRSKTWKDLRYKDLTKETSKPVRKSRVITFNAEKGKLESAEIPPDSDSDDDTASQGSQEEREQYWNMMQERSSTECKKSHTV